MWDGAARGKRYTCEARLVIYVPNGPAGRVAAVEALAPDQPTADRRAARCGVDVSSRCQK
ncbi:hypothetical protein GCM10009837_37090 [Streptomyces durmitorensis]